MNPISSDSNASPFVLPSRIESLLATLFKLYEGQGEKQLQKIIVNAKPRIVEGVSHDNWNGGLDGHALYLSLPEEIFLSVANDQPSILDRIKTDINAVSTVQNEFFESVAFEYESEVNEDWRESSGLSITRKKSVSTTSQDTIWEKNLFRVFLSHKSTYKVQTAELKIALKKYGITAFVAHDDIQPTQSWQDEIEKALFTMDAFVALITDDFHGSIWTDQEVGFAYCSGVPRICVGIGADPKGFPAKFQALKCSWVDAPMKIAQLLVSSSKMIDSLLTMIENCGGRDDYLLANDLENVLECATTVNSTQIERLINAYNGNSSISRSYRFNGLKPSEYGNGILPHLLRWTSRKYQIVYYKLRLAP